MAVLCNKGFVRNQGQRGKLQEFFLAENAAFPWKQNAGRAQSRPGVPVPGPLPTLDPQSRAGLSLPVLTWIPEVGSVLPLTPPDPSLVLPRLPPGSGKGKDEGYQTELTYFLLAEVQKGAPFFDSVLTEKLELQRSE